MTKKRHPAAGARTVAGAATALAFVGLVSGFQLSAAAEVAAPIPQPLNQLGSPTPEAPTVDPGAPAQPDPAPAAPAPAPAAPAPAPAAPAPAPADPAPVDGTSGGS